MEDRLQAVENILRILNKNYELLTNSADIKLKDALEVIDFIRQFAANLTNEQAELQRQAESKQDTMKVVDAEVVSQPSIG